ncbi:hypothetical protein [Williamsia sterculiae]|uniref:Uncharacterized protein n=1 Tax=Williamsia sterculiae TaxID=1344003 RepID=A0A1N7H3T9_9NOCA|nr:hypothetical protein [Williamsia sterculiae]SIS19515.1 hypothetical protein SAMN05445060_3489 [Williamsia sterculiae]
MSQSNRSDASRASATRLVLALRDEDPDAVHAVLNEAADAATLRDLAVAAATLAAQRISDDEAPALVAQALDKLAEPPIV